MATVGKKKDAAMGRRYPLVSVKNFGPIVEGAVNLRPLTVFVGPSNTGKTYLAVLIYAIRKILGYHNDLPEAFKLTSGFTRFQRLNSTNPEQIRDAAKWVSDISQSLGDEEEADYRQVRLPESVLRLMHQLLEPMEDSRVVSRGLLANFGTDHVSELVRYASKEGMSVSLAGRLTQGVSAEADGGYDLFADKAGVLRARLRSKDIVSLSQLRRALATHETALSHIPALMEFSLWDVVREIAWAVPERIFGDQDHGTYYLPAGRTGLMNAYDAAVANAIRGAPYVGLAESPRVPQFSGVIADFLANMLTIGRKSAPLSEQQMSLGTSLEVALLDGRIDILESLGEVPEFAYTQRGRRTPLPLARASSMVTEIAAVVLYLKHVVQSGDVLIIDEPESHLHPAMQVEFVRQLATIVKAGVRILITTHSEWILEELSNLVRLSGLETEDQARIDHPGPALNLEDVGVWLFEPKKRPKGSVIREIQFDAELGGYVSDYENVAVDTHNTWARISNRIEALREK